MQHKCFGADFALKKTGESGKSAPRLIDFIHEENIIVDFEPRNKDEAINYSKKNNIIIETFSSDIFLQYS